MSKYFNNSVLTLFLALSLAACSKETPKTAATAAAVEPSAAADLLSTSFEAACDSGATSTVANAAYDLSSCQLSPQHRAFISEIGKLKVEAEAASKTVRIRDAAGELVAETGINEDGTFSAPLYLGDRFGEVEGCPVDFQGLASGTVAFDAEGRVTKVDLNTAYNLAQAAVEGAAPAAPAPAVPPAGTAPAVLTQPSATDQPAAPATPPSAQPSASERPSQPCVTEQGPCSASHEQGDSVTGENREGGHRQGQQGKGGKVQPAKKGGHVQIGSGQGQGARKGAEIGKKGGGEHRPRHPRSNMEACVKFAPCAFTTSAALSCGR